MKKLLLSLTFIAAATAGKAQLVNAGLDAWHSYTIASKQLENPDGWFGVDSLLYAFGASPIPVGITAQQMLFKETASTHSGAAAARIVSRNQGNIGVMPGVLANAKPTMTTFNPTNPIAGLSYVGGTPINARIRSVSAWVKCTPTGTDKANIQVQAVLAGRGSGGRDSIVGQGDTILSQAISSYTKVGVNIDYNDPNVVPDKLLIIFLSSTLGTATSPEDGSTLWVDDVSMSIHPANIATLANKGMKVVCTPNPASGMLYISNAQGIEGTMHLYGTDGRLALAQAFGANTVVDISGLANGVYYYRMSDSKNELIQQDRIVVAH